MKQFTIWSNYPGSDYYIDLMQEAESEDFDAEAELYSRLDDLVDFNQSSADLIVLGDLGLWNGRAHGYKEYAELADCFRCGFEYAEWSIDQHNNLRCRTSHHDGTNYYLFREWKENLSEEQKNNFLEKLYAGAATSRDITRYTRSIGAKISF